MAARAFTSAKYTVFSNSLGNYIFGVYYLIIMCVSDNT